MTICLAIAAIWSAAILLFVRWWHVAAWHDEEPSDGTPTSL